MNLITIFFSFIILQAARNVFTKMKNKLLYDEINTMILNKIENREYVTFNSIEQYNKITLSFNEKNKFFCLNIEKKLSCNSEQKIEFLLNYYDNKSLRDIIEDIEYYLGSHLNWAINVPLILAYDPLNFESCPIMEDVVENIKKINQRRKVNKKGWEIYFEHICEKNSYLLDMLHALKHGTIDNQEKVDICGVYFCNKGKYNDRNLRFCIKEGYMCHLFELNVEQLQIDKLYSLSDTNIMRNNKLDEDILTKFLEICKFSDINAVKTYCLPYNLKIKLNKIEIPNTIFTLELSTDKIIFKQNHGKYFYCLAKDTKEQKDNNFIIEQKLFIEFRQLLKKIFEVKNIEYNCRGVEIFYRILKSQGKLKSLLSKILTTKTSSANLICIHLLLSGNIIDQEEFNKLMNVAKSPDHETLVARVINIITFNSASLDSLHFYLIKICLLIEAENFINENDVEDDKLCKTLMDINNLFKSKTNINETYSSLKEVGISLVNVIQKVINAHIYNIHYFIYEKEKHLCEIVELFTGLNGIFENKYDQIKHDKYKVAEILGLNKNYVEENAKIILKKISENNMTDKKYEETRKQKIKEMKQIENIFLSDFLIFNLKKIINIGLNRDLENFFDEKRKIIFENELINEAMEEIERGFKEHEDKIFLLNMNYKLVLEYKNDFEKKIKKTLKEYVMKNYKKRAINQLPKTLLALFESNLKIDKQKKEKSEKKFEFIKLILRKQEIQELAPSNSMIEFNERPIKVLDNLE
ncbi:uncharacterized protein VNE69_06111 [Vairimorpha necatrix]|uniref:Uncharacterized protein n=1 Tax=Vairimorpha necatrix TaxID=6039 RepID=A0AAX4JCV3_9MICR